jgi:2-oxoglutarate dehydrogenase complex dehydrogenase (E1) component-like enzyme
MAERDERKLPIPIVRVEQLYPFPHEQLLEIFARYPNATSVCWAQEEPENMGAWGFIFHNLSTRLPDSLELSYSARVESASPATGSAKIHEQEQAELIERALGV